MDVMDRGYLEQDDYRHRCARIPLGDAREETFTWDDSSWTEHISRTLGKWGADPEELIEALAQCGFHLAPQQEQS